MKVSIQGERGSYHDLVANHIFGSNYESLCRGSFTEVFEDTYRGRSDYGIIAIENSIVGSLHDNYDLLLQYELRIHGERYLRISHNLLVNENVRLRDIKEVRSHPIALRQCRQYLGKYPSWKIVEGTDTAGSCIDIVENNLTDVAAIASKSAAQVYGMKILAEGIETNKQNYTRFFVIAPSARYSQRTNKTSIVFTAADEPGSLGRVFQLFSELNVNVSKIESRPVLGRVWQYYFYLDFEAGIDDERSKKILEKIYSHVNFMRILGSYKQGVLIETNKLQTNLTKVII